MKSQKELSALFLALTFSLSCTVIAVRASDDIDTKSSGKENSQTINLGADLHPAPCLSWIDPQSKPRVALLCIHGLGLNSDAYTNFGKRMSHHGIATYAIDVRGFGSWMKANGNEQVNFDDCLGDVQATLNSIRAANPGIPVFLLGESMGGAIVLRACSLYPELMDGIISSVPAGERFKQKKTDLKVALEFLKGRHKQFDIGNQIVNQATKDPTLREDWEADPLDRMDLSAEQLLQFQKFMNDNHEAAEKIAEAPVLMLQGTLDKLVKPEGTWDLFNELATSKKTFVALPSEHLVLEEGQAKPSKYDANTAELVAGWIYGNLPDPSSSIAKVSASANDITSINPTSSGSGPVSNSESGSTGITDGAPVVLVFEDSWCVECRGLDELFGQAQKIFGTHVKVKTVNVSDPANASLVAKYKIAPIPTAVFLRKDGTVDSVLIGRGYIQNIAAHLRASAASARTQSITGSSK